MRRFFLLFLLLLTLVAVLFRTINVYYIADDLKQVSIRVIYGEKQTDLELEPYTLLGDVLEIIDLGDDVDFRKLNLNQVLAHKDTVVIPLISDIPCISINTATLEELMQLNGVGEKTAASIIDYRTTNGLFQSIEMILEIKGIGEAKFEKMRDAMCL